MAGPFVDLAAVLDTRLGEGLCDTPSLRARHLEKQHSWRPALAEALADRAGSDRPPTIALEYWTASDGRRGLVTLLDEAFASLKG
ncbi:hypothetical protein QFZ22_004815 [Streptomyces canus]|uniref:Uncharacterized protein n=1 Tax=Streptomyces canus TaxID=58343 RepID=A0AAW8FII0_9ACTN|nr:hypothetical protein [Streptomyces canus]MDQ0908830.1 hypothetical protein [Streptomyces canus]